MPFATTNDNIRIHYEEAGADRLLRLIHGRASDGTREICGGH